ncbi:MAG TPA: folate-binding protein [Casimicrobiaceae bacterium]|nr:folate-binding protein [Casimicrobiaceae bacterium]
MSTPLPFAPLPGAPVRARLAGLSALDVAGADALEFLHGQLSNDVKSLAVGAAHYASYNSAKGRMLATLIAWRREPLRVTLVLAADLAPAIHKRLAMYVLRSRLTMAIAARPLWGIVGADARAALDRQDIALPAPWKSTRVDMADVLALPDGRFLVDCDAGLPAAMAALPEADEAVWAWAGVRAGVPQVTQATSDLLIAQGANFELVGGVDFRKGCYPGQEIIARMQYLGRLKERLRAFHADAPAIAAGTPLSSAGRDESVGTVVNAAPSPAGGIDLLAVTRLDAGDAALFAGGLALAPRALPYAVPALDNDRVRL